MDNIISRKNASGQIMPVSILLSCILTVSLFLGPTTTCADNSSATKPNIVFILVDDLGYGDVQCMNPERGKIAIPARFQIRSLGRRTPRAIYRSLARGSGGWTSPSEKQVPQNSPQAQLYDRQTDPGETNNLYESRPNVAERLLAQLESDVKRGRSTEGEPTNNEAKKIVLWKGRK